MNEIEQQRVNVIVVWLDGSFVSSSNEPNDVDVVIYIGKEYSDSNRIRLSQLDHAFPELDIKWVPLYNRPDEPSEAIDNLEEMKWFLLFSSDRNNVPKGFVSLTD